MLKEALKNYVQNNLNIYFKNLDILLDGKFLLEIETVIECTFNKNTKLISHSLIHKEISSTGNNNIVKMCIFHTQLFGLKIFTIVKKHRKEIKFASIATT